MLQKIRDKASGWIAYAVIIMISIPFALWGIDSYFGGGARLVAMEINGEEITTRSVQREVQQQRQQLAELFGGRIPPGVVEDEALREAALQTIIRRELLRQVADQRGFMISDQSVARAIAEMEVFHEDGAFSRERYVRLLEMQRINRAAFEADMAMGMKLEQFEAGVRASSLVAHSQVKDYLRLTSQQRELSYFLISARDYAEQVEVDESSLQAFYDSNTDLFRTPERLKLAYVVLDLDQLASGLTVSEEELERFYRQRLDQFTTPEERSAAHILIRLDMDASQADVSAARSRALEIRARIEAGEDFAALAAELSEDRFTAPQGGDLGFLQRGDLGSALDGVLFTMSTGEISQPVRTREGLHLLRLVEVRPAVSQPLDAVREQLERDLMDRMVETMQIQMVEQMIGQSYEHPGSLDAVVDATGLVLQHSDWITRNEGEGIGEFPMVRQAAFSDEVLRQARNSQLIELPDGRALVLRVDEHEMPSRLPFEDVRDAVEERIRTDRSAELARVEGDRMLTALRDGTELPVASEGLPGQLVEDRVISRDDAELPVALLRHVFTMSAPAEDETVLDALALPNGDFAVIRLQAVRDVESDEQQIEAARNHLRALYGVLEFEAVLDALQEEATIKIFRENLS